MNHPVIVHVANADAMTHWAKDVPESALILANAMWPGPLTLVVPRADWVSDAITGGQPTIALRPTPSAVPKVLAALESQSEFPPGIAAPSANRFGRVSPTTAEHVAADIGQLLEPTDLILDGGPCTVGVESTIAICTDRGVRVARSGGISADQLAELVPVLDADDQPSNVSPERLPLTHYYAPSAAVTVVRTAAEFQREYRRHLLGADVGVIGLPKTSRLAPASWFRLASPQQLTTMHASSTRRYASPMNKD